MQKRIKIIQVNRTMNIGGIESFLMSVLRKIDAEMYDFVFLTYSKKHFDYEDEIASLGAKIVRISDPKTVSVFKHIHELYGVMKHEGADAVHSHTHFNSLYVLIAAFLANVPVRIVHSHTAYASSVKQIKKRFVWFFSRILLSSVATQKIACSSEAGLAMFNKMNFEVIPNGIDLSRFEFNTGVRESMRAELKVDTNTILFGHVGRFDTPKNHLFLIDVFKKFSSSTPNSKLVLVGSGKLDSDIRAKVEEHNLSEKVIFLGDRSDVDKLLNAFDYIVFPSIYEGLPVSLIEAQANGLAILVSNAVSEEVKVTDAIEFLPLSNGADEWARHIKPGARTGSLGDARLQEYDIKTTINKLQTIYTAKKER